MSYANDDIFESSDYSGGAITSPFTGWSAAKNPNTYLALAGIFLFFSAFLAFWQWGTFNINPMNTKNMAKASGWTSLIGMLLLVAAAAVSKVVKEKPTNYLYFPGIAIN